MSDIQMAWRTHGCVILRDVIPHDLCDAYWGRRINEPYWNTPTPYMTIPEIRDVCCHKAVQDLLEHIFGERMLLHLNLTNIVSTERAWHQDSYLNPPEVGGFYCGVWFAVGDVKPVSGPFQFVPGSQRWPWLNREKVLSFADPTERLKDSWPSTTERYVVPALRQEILNRRAARMEFLPARKGDILVWSPGLVHQGAVPANRFTHRPALIGHYSGVNHRPDMPNRDERGWFIL